VNVANVNWIWPAAGAAFIVAIAQFFCLVVGASHLLMHDRGRCFTAMAWFLAALPGHFFFVRSMPEVALLWYLEWIYLHGSALDDKKVWDIQQDGLVEAVLSRCGLDPGKETRTGSFKQASSDKSTMDDVVG
jgi:hypothetical protein